MGQSLTLYTNPRSRARIVRWMLEEVGQPYEVVVLDYGPAMKGPDYLKINPMGKVPALRHGDAVVTEAAACCAYLAQAFPAAGLMPGVEDHEAWANYYRWMFFCAGPLEAALTDRSLGVVVQEDRRGMVGYGSYEDAVRVLITAVDGKQFIAGSRFTVADVYVASHIAFGLRFGSIAPHPVLEDYAKRMKARPAAIRAEELDGGF